LTGWRRDLPINSQFSKFVTKRSRLVFFL